MKLAWQFFKRDAIMAASYRVAFAVQLLGNLLVLGVFYYIGKTIGDKEIPALAEYGGSYLAFLLIGIALTDCVGVSLTTFAKQIREGQLTGALEATLMSPVPLSMVLIYSSLWGYFLSAVRFVLYLVLGALLYGVALGDADLLSALVIFVLTVLCFAGIGMLWAAVIMLVKRGESIMTVGGYLVILVSGVLFPADMLPAWVQRLAELVPLTHALDGMRYALLRGYALPQLVGVMLKLGVLAAVLLVAGLGTFGLAVRRAKQTGSLTEY
ncbi:MAG: ABC transporter permease [Planctomycetes bacterium]|nr:ABC transporter permease [Planctomycetota bacterium]